MVRVLRGSASSTCPVKVISGTGDRLAHGDRQQIPSRRRARLRSGCYPKFHQSLIYVPGRPYRSGMRAMVVKEFRELVRDRRTLGLLIMMPLLLLVIFGYAANFYVSSLKTAVVGPQAAPVAGMLPPFFDVTQTQPSGTRADAETLLRDNRAASP